MDPLTEYNKSNLLGGLGVKNKDLKRALNYCADQGGCGLWRMIWPATLINGYQKAVIAESMMMIPDPLYYRSLQAVKIQRQATEAQTDFVYFLKRCSKEFGFKLIYDVDDIILYDDIPLYNAHREAFKDPMYIRNIQYILGLVDEFTVVSEYMKKRYCEKLDIPEEKVTVIPNYPPQFWLDRFYDEDVIMKNYTDNKKMPRVGYFGSGSHFDVTGKVSCKDDFQHVSSVVLSTIGKFKWVFMGGYPLSLRPYVQSGHIEYIPWTPIYDYPKVMVDAKINAVVAPLASNHFNRAKSDIKIIEAGAFGIPGTFQNLECYANAPSKFNTGLEMVENLIKILKDENTYIQKCREARAVTEGRWLEKNLTQHLTSYFGAS